MDSIGLIEVLSLSTKNKRVMRSFVSRLAIHITRGEEVDAWQLVLGNVELLKELEIVRQKDLPHIIEQAEGKGVTYFSSGNAIGSIFYYENGACVLIEYYTLKGELQMTVEDGKRTWQGEWGRHNK